MTNLNNWPYGGEIDIMEGINNQNWVNHYGFHTGGTCSMTGGTQSGEIDVYDCNVYDDGNSGCGGWATVDGTYGDDMNSYGGGVYAMDWRSTGIRSGNSLPGESLQISRVASQLPPGGGR